MIEGKGCGSDLLSLGVWKNVCVSWVGLLWVSRWCGIFF